MAHTLDMTFVCGDCGGELDVSATWGIEEVDFKVEVCGDCWNEAHKLGREYGRQEVMDEQEQQT